MHTIKTQPAAIAEIFAAMGFMIWGQTNPDAPFDIVTDERLTVFQPSES